MKEKEKTQQCSQNLREEPTYSSLKQEMNVYTEYTWIEKRTETEGMYMPSFLFFSLRL